ncbi:MAG: DNA gyrase subunit A [Candidatus Brennerbacteria bacterium]|nr:DNA gyrase subunit A [Candidatus Brennerbacteria bacterium]
MARTIHPTPEKDPKKKPEQAAHAARRGAGSPPPADLPAPAGGVEARPIADELRESYLDYAMSVIVSRALPDVRDGMKPVQRRILWAMWDLGLTHAAKFKKSANVVGEVLGKYHPHGDMAVYDAMARMAQNFSLRYTLVDGQGNWGSIDGDPPAAMRYTESRLSKIAEEMLTDIEKETVVWRANYDSSRLEPSYLPAKLPNLVVNGTVGIAVGMATSIPPHNLAEVAEALIYIAKHPDIALEELMRFVPGPDFPTGGVIYDRRAIASAYQTGRGSITMRGVAEIEEGKKNAFHIIITEIPYQVNKSDLVTKMAELVTEKRIEGVRDIRDESDREGLRIVLDLKTDAAPQKILNQLFEYTELQKNFHFNMLALTDGLQPQILSLKELLAAYLAHREDVIRRRTAFDLARAEERAHILEGLVKALDAIDEVIRIIKKSEDKEEARANLMKKFQFTEMQANAILEMRLQTLAALERERLEGELKEKKKLIGELKLILKTPARITDLVIEELGELKKDFPEPRRTKVIASGLKEFKDEDLIAKEDIVLVLTEDGYLKRLPPSAFRAQRRGGKGLIGFDLKEEDQIRQITAATTHDNVLFFTDRGRAFQTKAYEIPVSSRTAKGKSVLNFLSVPQGEKITALVAYDEAGAQGKFLAMATKGGVIKKTPLGDFANVRRSGLAALNLKNGDALQWATLSSGTDEFILVTAQGASIRFKEKDVRPMGRSAGGVGAVRLKKGDEVAGLDIISAGEKSEIKNQKLLVVMSRGYAKQTPLKEYKVQRRGGGGIKTANVTEKTGRVMAAIIVSGEEEEVLAFSSKGQALRTKLADIRIAGRATQGVRIMNLEAGDTLIGLVCL